MNLQAELGSESLSFGNLFQSSLQWQQMKCDEVRDNITCSQLPGEGVGQTEIPSEEKARAWSSLLQPQQSCHTQRHRKASAQGNPITCDHLSVHQFRGINVEDQEVLRTWVQD